MRVVLAGYNVDSRVLTEAEQAGVPRERMTPEVLSAAYARISRDPRPASELRRVALDEVEKARSSNRKIIFGMGHHSVAEHAVFNFDVLGISRLAIEELEKFRLCSFTEKSQRYITLDHDFVLPEEFSDSPFEQKLLGLIGEQAALYEKLYEALDARLKDKYPDMAKKKSGRRVLEGWAKEDARYVTVLATSGQLGLTVNARNLEHIVRRLAASKNVELKQLGRTLHESGANIAPSLLLFTEPSDYDTHTFDALNDVSAQWFEDAPKAPIQTDETVRLVEHTPDIDCMVAAALLHRASGRSYEECRSLSTSLDETALKKLYETALGRMEFYDAPVREFEHVDFKYEVSVSAACYAQLKRHRMSTQSLQDYDPALGVTVPPAIVEVGMQDVFMEHMARCEELYAEVKTTMPAVAPYVLSNAHRRRVFMSMNLRELYHFVRLRDDQHAQWDIRDIAGEMRKLAQEVAPLGTLLLSGKDSFVERFEAVFGKKPKLDPNNLDPLVK